MKEKSSSSSRRRAEYKRKKNHENAPNLKKKSISFQFLMNCNWLAFLLTFLMLYVLCVVIVEEQLHRRMVFKSVSE
jgi:hypothetical protein